MNGCAAVAVQSNTRSNGITVPCSAPCATLLLRLVLARKASPILHGGPQIRPESDTSLAAELTHALCCQVVSGHQGSALEAEALGLKGDTSKFPSLIIDNLEYHLTERRNNNQEVDENEAQQGCAVTGSWRSRSLAPVFCGNLSHPTVQGNAGRVFSSML